MQKDSQPRMHTEGRAFVRPLRDSEPITFRCSATENMCARVHHTVAQFFTLPSGANIDEIFYNFKNGLSMTMTEFPVLTGTLRVDPRGEFSVEVPPSPHAGSYFHFSDVSNDPKFPSFSELQDRGFPYMDGDLDGLKVFRPDPYPTSEDGQPTFTSKICRIRGGLVWTASLSHLVTDLMMGSAMMTFWAKNTKIFTDAAGKPVPIPKTSPWPDRGRLLPAVDGPYEPSEIAALNKELQDRNAEYRVADPTDSDKMLELLDNVMLKADVSEANPEQLEYFLQPTSGIWRFKPAKLRTLLDSVKAVDPNVKLSQFDILTAFMWQRLYMAKRGNRVGDELPTAQIMTAFDVRRKLNPPLPHDYYGACVDLQKITVDRELIKPKPDNPWKALSDIAKNVRVFGRSWDETAYVELLKISQRTPICPGIIPVGPMDMLVTDHSFFKFGMMADWGGEVGTCAAFREPYIKRDTPQGELIILPKQPNGDQEVLISAEEIVLERLLADNAMSTLCENVCVRHNVVDSLAMMPRKKSKL